MKTKTKTRKSAAKRFKVTKSGKVIHRGHGARHLKSTKSKRRLRRMKSVKQLTGIQRKKVRRMTQK